MRQGLVRVRRVPTSQQAFLDGPTKISTCKNSRRETMDLKDSLDENPVASITCSISRLGYHAIKAKQKFQPYAKTRKQKSLEKPEGVHLSRQQSTAATLRRYRFIFNVSFT